MNNIFLRDLRMIVENDDKIILLKKKKLELEEKINNLKKEIENIDKEIEKLSTDIVKESLVYSPAINFVNDKSLKRYFKHVGENKIIRSESDFLDFMFYFQNDLKASNYFKIVEDFIIYYNRRDILKRENIDKINLINYYYLYTILASNKYDKIDVNILGDKYIFININSFLRKLGMRKFMYLFLSLCDYFEYVNNSTVVNEDELLNYLDNNFDKFKEYFYVDDYGVKYIDLNIIEFKKKVIYNDVIFLSLYFILLRRLFLKELGVFNKYLINFYLEYLNKLEKNKR